MAIDMFEYNYNKNRKFKHRFTLMTATDILEEIFEWIQEQDYVFNIDYIHDNLQNRHGFDPYSTYGRIYFADTEPAMAFKLRWE